jgi:hypothetical protein
MSIVLCGYVSRTLTTRPLITHRVALNAFTHGRKDQKEQKLLETQKIIMDLQDHVRLGVLVARRVIAERTRARLSAGARMERAPTAKWPPP